MNTEHLKQEVRNYCNKLRSGTEHSHDIKFSKSYFDSVEVYSDPKDLL